MTFAILKINFAILKVDIRESSIMGSEIQLLHTVVRFIFGLQKALHGL